MTNQTTYGRNMTIEGTNMSSDANRGVGFTFKISSFLYMTFIS